MLQNEPIGKFTEMKTNNTKANDDLVNQMQSEIKAVLDALAALIAEAEAAGSEK